MTRSAPPLPFEAARFDHRLICLIITLPLLFLLGIQAVEWVKVALGLENSELLLLDRPMVIFTILLIYGMLIGLPFVPGAELGFLLLMVGGAKVAPFVYLATVVALTISYLVGRSVSPDTLAGVLKSLLPTRSGDRVAQLLTSGHDQSKPCGFRCLSLVVMVNLPGNSVLGGGGGIALMAGASRFLGLRNFVLSVAVATAPVPIGVMLMAF